MILLYFYIDYLYVCGCNQIYGNMITQTEVIIKEQIEFTQAKK